MHAPQVVQAHKASGERANSSSGRGLGAPFSKGEDWMARKTAARAQAIQLHPFVDLERRRAERLAGGGRRAGVLTTVALNTGKGVEQTRPRQILELARADLARLRFRPSEDASSSRSIAGSRPELAVRAKKYLSGAMKMCTCLVQGK